MITPAGLVRVRYQVDLARVRCLELTSVEIPVFLQAWIHWARVKVRPESPVMAQVPMIIPEEVGTWSELGIEKPAQRRPVRLVQTSLAKTQRNKLKQVNLEF